MKTIRSHFKSTVKSLRSEFVALVKTKYDETTNR